MVKKILKDLLCKADDGRVSHTKLGMIIAGATMTYHMLTSLPSDPLLWLVYLGTVGGYAAATRFIERKNA